MEPDEEIEELRASFKSIDKDKNESGFSSNTLLQEKVENSITGRMNFQIIDLFIFIII